MSCDLEGICRDFMERPTGEEKLLANSRHQMPNMLACQTLDDFSCLSLDLPSETKATIKHNLNCTRFEFLTCETMNKVSVLFLATKFGGNLLYSHHNWNNSKEK